MFKSKIPKPSKLTELKKQAEAGANFMSLQLKLLSALIKLHPEVWDIIKETDSSQVNNTTNFKF